MKTISQEVLLSISASFFVLIGAPSMLADQPACNAASLQGAYGYTVSGSINPGAVPALPPGPFAAVGRLVFNGNGGVTTVRTLSANGIIARGDSGSGTYSVNASCMGSFSISIATPGGTVLLNLDLVLDDENKQIRAIVTNAGYILALEGRKQFSSENRD